MSQTYNLVLATSNAATTRTTHEYVSIHMATSFKTCTWVESAHTPNVYGFWIYQISNKTEGNYIQLNIQQISNKQVNKQKNNSNNHS